MNILMMSRRYVYLASRAAPMDDGIKYHHDALMSMAIGFSRKS